MEIDFKELAQITEGLGAVAKKLEFQLNKSMVKLEKKATPEELEEAKKAFDAFGINEKTAKMRAEMDEVIKKFK
tara:strand:+ start:1414 stop:1635 length:222 start_codon:yes stop_codon:yes gene_type:complete